jgi:hypothetical protein
MSNPNERPVTAPECGCRIAFDSQAKQFVEHCPRHAAVDALVDALGLVDRHLVGPLKAGEHHKIMLTSKDCSALRAALAQTQEHAR